LQLLPLVVTVGSQQRTPNSALLITYLEGQGFGWTNGVFQALSKE